MTLSLVIELIAFDCTVYKVNGRTQIINTILKTFKNMDRMQSIERSVIKKLSDSPLIISGLGGS